jgi:glycosyltransferase involved in cell wall biosynthesis
VPEGTIVIPAHNEAAVIDRTLGALAGAIQSGRAQVIVSCNGCTDDTADRARAHAGVVVLETDVPSKVAALRAADVVALSGPRIYLDADVVLTSRAALAVLDALAGPEPRAARPPVRFETTGSAWPVRRWYRVRGQLPTLEKVVWGAGMYALSTSARARFGEFPDLVSDDLFIDSLLNEDEVIVVETDPVIVTTPRSFRSLLLVLRRTYRTQSEVQSAPTSQALSSGQRSQLHDLRWLLGRRRISVLDAVVYPAVVAWSRVLARVSRTSAWERDESSRQPESGLRDSA